MAVERIVVASDRSQTATRAVAWAAEMARRYGAQLIVVQAFVPGPPPPGAETDLAVLRRGDGRPRLEGPGASPARIRATRSSPPPTRRRPTSSSSATSG